MSEYTEPRQELEGQTSLLGQPNPAPRPHGGMRLAVLRTLETATAPLDSHQIADLIYGQQSGWVAKRLQELEDDGQATRVGTHKGRYGRHTTLWETAS